MSNSNVITNRNGQLSSATGEKAVQAFALRSLIVSLQTEAKLPKGMKLSRVPLKKIAKARTGLRTNNVEKLCDALTKQMNELLAYCDVVIETPAKPDQPGEAPRCTRCGAHRDAGVHLGDNREHDYRDYTFTVSPAVKV